MNQVVTVDAELPQGFSDQNSSLAVQLVRAEVDQQITTAKAYPRSIDRAIKNIKSLATLDEQSAMECIYALPRGGNPIKGPSIRLAEIIATQWGNCRVGARVVHVDRVEKYVEAEGVFHDLETNVVTTARVRRRISDKQNRLLKDDMIIVTGNAACSIAKRNAILGSVPKGVWRNSYDAVEKVLAGDIKTLSVKRIEVMKAFAAFGVTPERVYTAINIKGDADISADHLITLYGMYQSLKSGEETVESLFAADVPPPARPKPSDFKPPAAAAETVDPTTGEITEDKPAEPDPRSLAFARGETDFAVGIGMMSEPAEYNGDKALIEHRRDGWREAERLKKEQA
jgi:hypothetical protein